MEDVGYFFYAIPHENSIRIVGGKIIEQSKQFSNIVEAVIAKKYFKKVEKTLEQYYIEYLA